MIINLLMVTLLGMLVSFELPEKNHVLVLWTAIVGVVAIHVIWETVRRQNGK